MKVSVHIPDDLYAGAMKALVQLGHEPPGPHGPGPSAVAQEGCRQLIAAAAAQRRRRRASQSPLAKVAKAQAALVELEVSLLAAE